MRQYYVTKQDDIRDCGAASISSIIKYYGGYVPLETLKRDSFISKDGISAYHLIMCLNKYNFEAKGYRYEDNFNFTENIKLPAIIHLILKNGLHHFVVLYKIDFKKNTCLIMDPAVGYKKLTIKELLNIWSKVIIIISPKGKIQKYKKDKTIFKIFLKLLLSEKTLLIKIIFTSIILTLSSILSSFYIKTSIENNNTKISSGFIIIFLSIVFIKIIINYLRTHYENHLNKNVDKKIIIPFIRHTFLLPLNYIKSKSSGEILTRVKELNNIKNLFSKIFVTIFLDLLLTLITLFIILEINSTLFLVLCLILVLYFLIGYVFAPKIKRSLEELLNNEADFNSTLVENIEGIETIKNSNTIDVVLSKINSKFNKELNNSFNFSKLINNQSLFKSMIEELGIFVLLTIGLILIKTEVITILDIITFNSLLFYILEPYKNIIDLIPEIYYIKQSVSKISEYLEIEEEKLNNTNIKLLNNSIFIENLTFSYDKYNYLFNNYNLQIKPTEKVLLKGSSGSGKSTLCKLIYRLYDYEKGNIKINKKDIKEYDLNTIRSNISYLSQREKLFSGTIKENILFGKEVSDSYFWQIIKICRLEELINNKTFKEHTMLIDGDFNLSGGEMARIVLARSLIKNSKILILDEALKEIPEDMERNIILDIKKRFKEKTLIYVSHRSLDDIFERVIYLNKEKNI